MKTIVTVPDALNQRNTIAQSAMNNTKVSFGESFDVGNSFNRRDFMMPQVRSVDPRERHHAANTVKFKLASNAVSSVNKSQDGIKGIPPEINGK